MKSVIEPKFEEPTGIQREGDLFFPPQQHIPDNVFLYRCHGRIMYGLLTNTLIDNSTRNV